MAETRTLRILHIEDDPADAELAGIALEKAGVSCLIHRVASRKECIAALEDDGFDLVLSDSHGPDFDARSLLRLVRARLPETPFVFLSGSFYDNDPETLKAEGATDCLLKDDLDALVAMVRRLLAKSSPG